MKKTSFLLSSAFGIMLLVPLSASAASEQNQLLIGDSQSLSFQDINLSGAKFFKAWTSAANPQERQQADLYLLGVLDATEGKGWCGYQTLKSGTLQEVVFSYFKKLSPERLQERASRLIEEAIMRHHSCDKGDKS